MIGTIDAGGEVALIVIRNIRDIGRADALSPTKYAILLRCDRRIVHGVNIAFDSVDDRVSILVDTKKASVEAACVIQK